MYIQIITNPVVTKSITVPITQDINVPENAEVSYSIKSVDLVVVGRAGTLNTLTADDIIAAVDYQSLEPGYTGVVELPVEIMHDDGVYFRVDSKLPEKVSVTVYSAN